jgi:hypothetical protein
MHPIGHAVSRRSSRLKHLEIEVEAASFTSQNNRLARVEGISAAEDWKAGRLGEEVISEQ